MLTGSDIGEKPASAMRLLKRSGWTDMNPLLAAPNFVASIHLVICGQKGCCRPELNNEKKNEKAWPVLPHQAQLIALPVKTPPGQETWPKAPQHHQHSLNVKEHIPWMSQPKLQGTRAGCQFRFSVESSPWTASLLTPFRIILCASDWESWLM